MKLLSISSIPLLPFTGSGYTRLHWTEGLRNSGHEVDVLEPKDFEFIPRVSKAKKYRQAIGLLLTVTKLINTKQYDIVEFYGDEAWLLLLWLKKIKRNRPLLIAHADGLELLDMEKEQTYWNPRRGIKKWVDNNTRKRFSKIAFALADKFVCGCKDDLDYAITHNYFKAEDAVCIPPGIEDSFHALPFVSEKEKIIIFLGSWIKRKGIALVPEIISKILTDHPDYRFHVYGAWHSKAQILESISQQVAQQVTVFEKLPKEDLLKGILQSSIFFFPSYSEGFGLATAEAMSCSCAVVTTKTGIGSQLINGNEALVCDFNDTAGMIKALDELINNKDLRNKIAANGYHKSKEFKWSTGVKALEAVYVLWCTNE